VLKLVEEDRKLVNTSQSVAKRNGLNNGHILRGESLMKDVLVGRMEGKRHRGRNHDISYSRPILWQVDNNTGAYISISWWRQIS